MTIPAVRRIAALALGLLLGIPALADFINSYTPPYRGAPYTEYSGWESFTSAYQGANAPDDPRTSSDDALIVQTTPGAFLTGGNIYSFSSVSTFELHDTVPGDLQEVALQISTKGNELAYANVRLRYVDQQGVTHHLPFTAYKQLAYTVSQGVDVESLFQWDLASVGDALSTFQILFEASTTSVSLDAVLLDVRWAGPQSTYCSSQVNSQGCTPAIGFSGTPSATAGSGFTITASQVLVNKSGLYFYSVNGPASMPFQGGTLCVAPPIIRTTLQNSGGSGVCGGTLAFDFNAWIASGADPTLAAGNQVWGQYWSRDPASTFSINLTDAITFVIGQ